MTLLQIAELEVRHPSRYWKFTKKKSIEINRRGLAKALLASSVNIRASDVESTSSRQIEYLARLIFDNYRRATSILDTTVRALPSIIAISSISLLFPDDANAQ